MGECILCKREIADGGGDYCCGGCEAVAQIISNMDLQDEEKQAKVDALLSVVFPADKVTAIPEESEAEYTREAQFLVDGMFCPACSWLVHHSLEQIDGVLDVQVNFLTEQCCVRYDLMKVGEDDLRAKTAEFGYELRQTSSTERFYDYYSFGIGWFLAINAMMLSLVVYTAEYLSIPPHMEKVCSYLLLLCTVLTVGVSGRDVLRKGWGQIRRLQFRMETLIILSTGTAFVYSIFSLYNGVFSKLYFDVVCLLIMLVETGNLITTSFYSRLRKRVEELRGCLPRRARVIRNGKEDYVTIDEMQPGSSFTVERDEVVPTDGLVLQEAEFDFSLINGESRGVSLSAGQHVGAGAKLVSEEATLIVPPNGRSSLIEDIINSTISAFNTQRERQTLGDRISQYFVPTVFTIAVAGGAAYMFANQPDEAIAAFMRVLIVACPCAFGIAEPLVLAAAVDQLKRMGIQIFNGNVLRIIPNRIIFDKTGTLTKASMTVKTIHWLVDKNQRDLDILASLESGLEHPIAKALAALGKGITIANRETAVQGVEGDVDGVHYRCGKIVLFPNLEVPPELDEELVTLVAFGDSDRCRLIVALEDEIRSEAGETLSKLRGDGIQLEVCSGDRAPIVAHVARELGIDEYHADMKPADKQQHITALQDAGEHVMMLGDGINDAQSLAAADFGLSVFSGQIPAQMSSDAVLLTNDLSVLPKLFAFLKRVRGKITANYAWALSYNIVGIALALTAVLTPTFCAIGMVFSNTVVIYNSLRLSSKADES